MALPGVVAHPRPLCASLMFNLFLLSRTKQLTIIFSGTLGGGTLCLQPTNHDLGCGHAGGEQRAGEDAREDRVAECGS